MAFYDVFAIVLGVVSVVALVLGGRMLIRGGWLLGWLRGMLGVVVLGLAATLALVALDLRTYRALLKEKPIATLSFQELGPQHFQASLIPADEALTRQFELRGDQWQLDARIIRWKGWVQSLGGKPGYRLDRIGGRYHSVEDEREKPRTVYDLGSSEYGVDVWDWARRSEDKLPWVDTQYGSATYVPMADGAVFEVALSYSGLVARPLNGPARAAINQWQ